MIGRARRAGGFWRPVLHGWLLLVFLLPAGCRTPGSGVSTSITLLHTNDTHSHLESFTPFGEPEQGGVARRQTLIRAVRADKGDDRVLLVDAGDFFQGTVFYNAWKGSADIMALNDMGYDAATLGNHEFDSGPEELGRALRGAPVVIDHASLATEPLIVPLVAANLDVSGEAALAGLIRPSIVVRKGGVEIGIVGVITETAGRISDLGPRVVVREYAASVQAEVERLRRRGIDRIVLLSHAGYAVDKRLAPQLAGVDIIVSGHDHPLLLPPAAYAPSAPLAVLADRVVGEYPTVTAGRDGAPVLIVGAYEWGGFLGRLDVTFDRGGVLSAWRGAPLFVDGSVVPEPRLAERVASYKAPIAAFAAAPIGRAAVFFDGGAQPGLRTGEMPLGNLVADAVLAVAAGRDKAVAALINGGGLRAGLPVSGLLPGAPPPYQVTFGDALTVLPFGNSIVTMDVTGRQLVAALDNGLGWAFDQAAGASRASGAFPQVAGLRATYCADRVADMHRDVARPASCAAALLVGGVVTDLRVADRPVDLEATYRLATSDYLAGGGDYYDSLAEACNRAEGYCLKTGLLMLDALVAQFADHAPVARPAAGRLLAR